MINGLTAHIEANEVNKGLRLHPEEHFPTPCRSPTCKASSLKSPPTSQSGTVQHWNQHQVDGFTPGGDVSCAMPGGQSGRSCVHSRGTGTVSLPCACGSVSSVRPIGQTSMCSLPTCTCTASHLEKDNRQRTDKNRKLVSKAVKK